MTYHEMAEEPDDDPYRFPITGELDLHTFRPDETKSIVKEYIYECCRRGIRSIRIVHGKGKSVQKHIVQKVLTEHPLVIRFSDAPPGRGGWGATVAELRDSE